MRPGILTKTLPSGLRIGVTKVVPRVSPRPAPLSHAASERRGNKVKSLTGLEPENQGQNLALTVLCVPYSLNRLLPENQTQNLALTVLSVPYSLHSVAKPVHQGTNKLRQGEKMQLGGRKETESRGGDSERTSGGGGGGGGPTWSARSRPRR